MSANVTAEVKGPLTKYMPDRLNSVGQVPAVSPTLSSWGITELLENDPRPSFVLELEDSQVGENQHSQIVFSNSALQRHPRVSRLIHGRLEISADALEAVERSRFKEWIGGAAPSTSVYGGLCWTCSTLRKRWRIFNGDITRSRDALDTPANPSGEFNPAASALQTGTRPAGEQLISTLRTRDSHRDHSASVWVEGLPQNTHVKFFKDTDWSATSLGPLEAWPSLLRQTTRFLMADSRPACLCWYVYPPFMSLHW